MVPHELSQKNYENFGVFTSGLCLAFKILFGLFSIFLAFRYLENCVLLLSWEMNGEKFQIKYKNQEKMLKPENQV